ncbi:MAG: X-Pro dipeptidyl-peptidase [Actinomycetota bacterium]|nr:X-Pro dipeptidyl-peptidase [Actinomycetota bacterium]
MIVAFVAACLLVPAGASARVDRGPRNYPEFTYERVRVEMRDGIELSADIYRPATPKNVRVPVILSMSPYHLLNRALDRNEADLPSGDGQLFVPKGYAYVVADVRGTYNSGGCWDYGGINERHDGYDLVEWLGTRDWSNGKVAMTGASYDGTTANAAAVENPPHLATIVPVSSISRWWGYAYQQGVRATYSGESADIDPPSDTPTDFMFAYGFLPPPDPGSLTAAQQIAMRWNVCDRVEKFMKGYSTQPDYDKFWQERDYLRLADRVKVPVLVTHGQLDFNVKTWEGTQWFQAVKTEKAMVIGQWPHASPRGNYPEWDFFLERWFERWLYGVHNGVEDEPAIRIETNDNVWRTDETWGGVMKRFPLLGSGPAVEFNYTDDGHLTESEMTRGIGSGYMRIEVPGTTGIRIQGRPILHLSASSDAASTHLVGILCDVGPSGSCGIVSRAALNARFNDGLTKGKDLEPGKVYDFKLEFIDKDYVLAKDHHFEVIVASSSNTWFAPNEERATNTIYLKDSFLDLPIQR